MLNRLVDATTRSLAQYLQDDHMRRLGIANTMAVAGRLNGARHRSRIAYRREAYRNRFDELLRGNGLPRATLPPLADGYLVDRSMSLPHLDRLLADAGTIIDERTGPRRPRVGKYRNVFRDIQEPGDLDRYPSILDFALSSDVLRAVCGYLQCVPALLDHLPGGIRFAESSIEYDDSPGVLKDSQLFHIDYFSKPDIYMIVLLKDVTLEHGPFTFVPEAASQAAAKALNYWGCGRPYRMSDEDVYRVLSPRDVIPFTGPKGSVLFFDPSVCLHFGSRNCVKPRYQLMYAYGTTRRTDFNAYLKKRHFYPVRPADSELARLILDAEYRSPRGPT